jgi:hypothetical protein
MMVRSIIVPLAIHLFSCLGFNAAIAASCSPPPSGLIGWWPGDGNANDLLQANNGSLQGGATAFAAVEVNTAFSFDGTNAFVQIPNSATLRPTNLTIEAWVRFSGLDSAGSGGSPAGDQYIVFRQNTRNSDFEGFDLSKTRPSQIYFFGNANATNESPDFVPSFPPPPAAIATYCRPFTEYVHGVA